MNREIKFRVWNIHEKEFMFLDIKAPLDIYILSPYKIGNMPSECIISQYTGLKDSTDKEVYEGDILSTFWFDRIEKVHVKYETNTLVQYGQFENCGCCNTIFGMGFNIETESAETKIKIIGNLFENPELLEASCKPPEE